MRPWQRINRHSGHGARTKLPNSGIVKELAWCVWRVEQARKTAGREGSGATSLFTALQALPELSTNDGPSNERLPKPSSVFAKT